MTARRRSAIVTAQEAALQEMRSRIASGLLLPGEQIRQETLAAELGLSVVPLREALKTLEAEGQVVYAPHRGYFVARLDVHELTEAYRIRELLEDEAARRGIPKLVEEDLQRMADAIKDIDRHIRAKDIAAVAASNRRFHFTIFDAADMPRLVNFIRILWETTEPYRSLYIAEPRQRRRINDEHREILAAVRSGDVDRAVEQLASHRNNAISRLKVILQPDESGRDES